jgi:hypothetical protein
MADRKLAVFDLLPEDIPELAGAGGTAWTPGGPWAVPLVPALAGENQLLVRCDRHPGKFRQVLAFACRLLEQANPSMRAAQANWEYRDGEPIACTVFLVPEQPGR